MPTTLTIGRAPDNTIVVGQEYETVSNRHADLSIGADGRLIFTDHSSNGTEINGREFRNQAVYVEVGDNIRLAGRYPLDWAAVIAAMPELTPPVTDMASPKDLVASGAGADSAGTERFSNQQSLISHFSGSQADPYEPGAVGANPEDSRGKKKSKKKEAKQSVHRSNGSGSRRFPWTTVILCFVAFLAVMSILAFTVFDDVVKNLM